MALTLRELDAALVRREVRRGPVTRLRDGVAAERPSGPYGDDDWHVVEADVVMLLPVAAVPEADGVTFLCPACYRANGGSVGTHSVLCWFEGRVPDDEQPGPGRWRPTGTGVADLSFVPGQRSCSVMIKGDCQAHFFVTNGEIRG